jgi:hypothetical protein
MRNLIFFVILLASSTLAKAQSYVYQYVDPCTKNVKFISVPLNGANIAVTYYGQVGTFSSADFNNGNFINWLNQTSGTNAGRPCDQATTQAVNSTNMVITNNIISTLTNITSVSTMAAGLSANVASASSSIGGNLGNTVSNGSSGDGSGNGSSGGSRKNNRGNGNSSGNNNNNSNGSTNSTGNTQSSGSSGGTVTGSNQTGSTSTGSGSTGGTGSGSTESTSTGQGSTGGTGTTGTGSNGNTNTSGQGSTGGTGTAAGTAGTAQSTSSGGSGGTANSVSNATEATSSGGSGGTSNSVSNAAEATSGDGSSGGSGGGKNGDKNRAKTGALIGTGDIVAVQSTEEGEREQFRFTMSMTKSNTKNTFARGFLGNFTTQVNNSNITFYGAWTLPKSKTTIIAANSSMLNLEKDFFNTTTLLTSKRFTKLSIMGGVNFTAGKIGETGFQNLSAVGGGFYMFGVGKKITSTLLVLGVYSPFTQFYEGNWWSSGVLIVPFSSWDYSITKKFKFNLSFSGTYELNKNMLNYQILTGGKVML